MAIPTDDDNEMRQNSGFEAHGLDSLYLDTYRTRPPEFGNAILAGAKFYGLATLYKKRT